MSEAERYVIVATRGEHFGLRAQGVLKVIELGPLTRVPRMPEAIAGVTSYRGRVITVVDVARLIGQEPKPVGSDLEVEPGWRVVLLDSGQRNLGLRVDAVVKIATMDQVEPRREVSDEDLVMSVASSGEMTVGLIDPERLATQIAGLCDPV